MTDRTRSGSLTPRHYGIRPTQTGKQQVEVAAAVGRENTSVNVHVLENII